MYPRALPVLDGACDLPGSRGTELHLTSSGTGARACHVAVLLGKQAGPRTRRNGPSRFLLPLPGPGTGRRAWRSELSTIDTAILLAGALTSAAYFNGASPKERELRTLAQALYDRADWQWAQKPPGLP